MLGLLTLVLVGQARVAVATSYVEQPEKLIPATAQVYLRWDGVAAHREQYAQTAIGQLLAHDLAPLRQQLLEQYPKLLRSELTERKLLDGMPPARLAKIHAAVAESSKLLDVLAEHGIVASAEINPPNLLQMAFGAAASMSGKKTEGSAFLPRVQVMLIVPEAAADAGPILSALRLFDTDKTFEVKDETVARRKLLHVSQEGVHVFAWAEG
ncbi:MAG TPA: hypothetical protein VH120_05820, partial [Gemmataceae bacterium]|nr:hypothetical protein [Gemmataceae bacterium]